MRCPDCRSPVDPDFHAVCPECGASIRADVLAAVPATAGGAADPGAGAGLLGADLPEPAPGTTPGVSRTRSRAGLLVRIGLVVALVFGGSIWGWITSAKRDANGTVTSAGTINVMDMREGDCAELPQLAGDEGIQVDKVKVTPCTAPHDVEVFGLTTLSAARGEPYPGDEAAWVEAILGCMPLFEEFTGTTYTGESTIDMLTLYPTEESWSKVDDRGAICMLYRVDGAKLMDSLRAGL